jgi:hypothetical protein
MSKRITSVSLHKMGWMGAVAGRVAVWGLLALTVCGCQAAAEQPAGLSTDPPDTPSRTPTPAPESDGPASQATVAEPVPSFSQPYLSGEPSVVELPEALALEPPPDATDAEADVVDAAAKFMASWNAVLFGAGVERSRIEQTATAVQLDTLIDYAAESEKLRRVIVGEPMRLRLLDVDVAGSNADVDICLEMIGWVEVADGVVGPLMPSLERYVVSMTRSGSDWLATGTQQQDPAECG